MIRSFELDARLTPARGDIAAAYLRGKVEARAFVEGERRQVIRGHAALRLAPEPGSEQDNQALFGDTLMVYDERDGWVWGQLERDRYVGWMQAEALSAVVHTPTHWMRALRTIVFERPNLKTPPVLALSMTARLAIEDESGAWRKIAGSGWVFASHIAPIGQWESDFVAVAQRFVGAPYLWGGRESTGIDCSGLVQTALAATGVDALRDSDMQAATVGEAVAWDGAIDRLVRGDLVFWRGHVGIVLEGGRLLHANAWHMATEIEPLDEAITRIRAAAGEVTTVRRLRST